MSSSSVAKKKKNWIPLESNPDLLNNYLKSLGVDTSQYQYVDVFGTDPDLLCMVPQPIIALLLLFPHSASQVSHAAEEEKSLSSRSVPPNPSLFHIRQTIGNACGTIGVLHSVLNNRSTLSMTSDGFAQRYFQKTKDMTYEERGRELEDSDDIEEHHQSIANEAKSDVNHSINDNLHFIAFVESGGELWELDGMKKRPISHGQTTRETMLTDCVEVVKQFMKRDEGDVRFNMVALAPLQD